MKWFPSVATLINFWFPINETHLDAVRGLILLKGFHFQDLIVGWRQEEHLAVKTISNTHRFMLYQNKDNILNTQKPYQVDRPTDYTRNQKWEYAIPWIVTLNVVTIRGQSAAIANMLSRRNVDVCCVQETHWKEESAWKIMGKIVIINSFGWEMSWDMVV